MFKYKFILSLFIYLFFQISSAHSLGTKAREAILIDMETGRILFEKNAYKPTYPASMTKMMVVYILFERLKDKSLKMDDTFSVSKKAWKKGGSKMFLEPRQKVKVHDLIQGIIVQSGNDATITLAEGLAGDESYFAEEMNQTAKNLGLTTANFKNSTGWPEKGHVISVYDLAKLARLTIKNFPELYKFYSQKTFTYNNITQHNRNTLLFLNVGNDGLKTGHTEASGYGLTASSVRNNRRLIAVVNGLKSSKERSLEVQKILNWGFREFDNFKLYSANESVFQAKVWLGEQTIVPLILDEDLTITVAKRNKNKVKLSVIYDGPIAAPIKKGDELGKLKVVLPNNEEKIISLKAQNSVEKLGFLSRMGTLIQHLIWGYDK